MEVIKEVIAFIQSETGTQDLLLTPATSLEEGLGLTGEDAADLLRAIAARYHVDLQQLRWEKYFHPEPAWGVTYQAVEPFTVADILLAVERGSFSSEYS